MPLTEVSSRSQPNSSTLSIFWNLRRRHLECNESVVRGEALRDSTENLPKRFGGLDQVECLTVTLHDRTAMPLTHELVEGAFVEIGVMVAHGPNEIVWHE
jgi:hypothetical protein